MRLGSLIGLVLLVSFIALIATVSIGMAVPVTLRATAPVLCPSGTERSIVVVTVSSYKPGQTSMTPELVCIDASGHAERPGMFRVLGVLFLMFWAGTWVLLSPAILRSVWRRLRGRRPEGAS
jgi:hypothetical protein